ncbi:hypothetical protein HYH03_012920 [Edaphochlamys debaryana]|uniref:Uncharacterized protein n=1 Tax=Edaphochlamys debaryana TaxID=47281 RepID=A0A835XUM1_9CHLO|nr:hypothetical protein HYH03_012920 [Edaphochlamys debaryana]|eukprot:KAG2488601.1 hypothetical protein HYH03_012920 [Edaphochlamys debaryana]
MAGPGTGGAPSSFFQPWEPMPAFAQQPADASLTERIQLLVNYAMKNGPSFIDMMRQKQAGDPKFGFLGAGEGSDYFRWLLYATAYSLPADLPPPAGTYPPHVAAAPAAPPVPATAPEGAPPPYGYAPAPVPGGMHPGAPPPYGMPAPAPYGAPPPGHLPPPGMYGAPPPHVLPPVHMQPPPGAPAPGGYPPPYAAPPPQPLPPVQPPPAQPPPPAPAPQGPPAPITLPPPEVQAGLLGLPADVAVGFSAVLDNLTASKDSIKSAAAWFMAHLAHAPGLASAAAARCVAAGDKDKQLHLIYLVNDVLFKGLAQRASIGASTDAVCAAFQPVLGAMLAAAFVTSGRAEDVRARLGKILNFWGEKHVYNGDTMEMMEDAAFNTDDPGSLLPFLEPLAQTARQQQQQQAAAAAAPWQQQPAPGAPGAGAAPWAQPGGAAGPYGAVAQPPAGGGWGPPQGVPAPPPSPWGPPMPGAPVPYGQPSPYGAPPPGQAPWAAGLPPGQPYGAPPPAPEGPQDPAALQAKAAAIAAELAAAAAQAAAAAAATVGMVPLGNTKVVAPLPGPDMSAQPTPSTNFPPGLIPELVRDKNKCEVPYTPLDPIEIDKIGLPPPPLKDAALLSRLERFHADCREYRPGLSRADLDEAIRVGRIRSRSQEREFEEAERERRSRRGPSGPMDDGSFAANRGAAKYAGLGAHEERPAGLGGGEDEGDMYSEYRRNRSGSYHEMIFKNAATAGPRR